MATSLAVVARSSPRSSCVFRWASFHWLHKIGNYYRIDAFGLFLLLPFFFTFLLFSSLFFFLFFLRSTWASRAQYDKWRRSISVPHNEHSTRHWKVDYCALLDAHFSAAWKRDERCEAELAIEHHLYVYARSRASASLDLPFFYDPSEESTSKPVRGWMRRPDDRWRHWRPCQRGSSKDLGILISVWILARSPSYYYYIKTSWH